VIAPRPRMPGMEAPDDAGQMPGWRRLLLAVLGQAVRDVRLRKYRDDALQWIMSPACEELCELVDVRYAMVRHLAGQDMPLRWSQRRTK
jgi:hypothetical protein